MQSCRKLPNNKKKFHKTSLDWFIFDNPPNLENMCTRDVVLGSGEIF